MKLCFVFIKSGLGDDDFFGGAGLHNCIRNTHSHSYNHCNIITIYIIESNLYKKSLYKQIRGYF